MFKTFRKVTSCFELAIVFHVGFKEKCGIFGIFSLEGTDVARLVYYGLWSLQHRGQENSGIVSSNGRRFYSHKGKGLVAHVYEEKDIDHLKGNVAIGHNRYSTFGKSDFDHSQPVFRHESTIALAHNGNLPQVTKLRNFLTKNGVSIKEFNDSELMHKMIEHHVVKGLSLPDAVRLSYPFFTGAFSLLIMSKNKLIGIRDECGIRPLCIGKINGSYILSSETCALDTVGATFVRDVLPGEMVEIDKTGIKSHQLANSNPKLDIFEFIYFARPDSVLMGKSVYDVRKNLGMELAKEIKVKADMIIPVPDSSIPSAIGYSQKTKIPLEQVLVKNRYIHRTFIKPSNKQRLSGVKMKLNVIASAVKGKSVALVDDSIVRGTTSKRLVELLRSAGAKEIHFLVTSPPVKYPDFYGIDTPKQTDLIAANQSISKLKKFIGADTLNYLSYDGMLRAIGVNESELCTSCFTGIYPINIGGNSKRIKKIAVY